MLRVWVQMLMLLDSVCVNTGGVSCEFVFGASSLGGVSVGGLICKDKSDTTFPPPGTVVQLSWHFLSFGGVFLSPLY